MKYRHILGYFFKKIELLSTPLVLDVTLNCHTIQGNK